MLWHFERQQSIEQAYRIQQRLRVWRPKRAAVLGASTLGLLSTLVLRLRGLEVTTFGNTMPPFLNSKLVEELGARYVSTKEKSLAAASAEYGPFDLIIEGTGYSPLVFESMNVLAKNRVLAMVSVSCRALTRRAGVYSCQKVYCVYSDPNF